MPMHFIATLIHYASIPLYSVAFLVDPTRDLRFGPTLLFQFYRELLYPCLRTTWVWSMRHSQTGSTITMSHCRAHKLFAMSQLCCKELVLNASKAKMMSSGYRLRT